MICSGFDDEKIKIEKICRKGEESFCTKILDFK